MRCFIYKGFEWGMGMGRQEELEKFIIKTKKLLVQWVYHNDISLINSPHRKSMDYFIVQVIFANAFAILTGGTYMSGYAIYLGASDELVGYIPIIGSIRLIVKLNATPKK